MKKLSVSVEWISDRSRTASVNVYFRTFPGRCAKQRTCSEWPPIVAAWCQGCEVVVGGAGFPRSPAAFFLCLVIRRKQFCSYLHLLFGFIWQQRCRKKFLSYRTLVARNVVSADDCGGWSVSLAICNGVGNSEATLSCLLGHMFLLPIGVYWYASHT